MEHITVGKKYNGGKIAFVECKKNCPLNNISIKDECFLLIILTKGRLEFTLGDEKISATAPAFLCFDESENPVLDLKLKARYNCIYFHPEFLNVNMTFDFLRSEKYGDIATTHDMFLLKPFIEQAHVIPISETQVEKVERSADYMMEELFEQRDWYWSCRGRSYFMEIIIALERMYGLLGCDVNTEVSINERVISDPKLNDAVLYIESNYEKNITLSGISANVGVNHTTLTALMKQELGCTAMEYLMKYRVAVAKKQLSFTNVPIKDIYERVGFKTLQHFNRIFKEHTGLTPAEFRKITVQKRKDEIK